MCPFKTRPFTYLTTKRSVKISVESIGRNGIFYATTLKCLKHALKTVTNDRSVYEEVLRTFLVEVESTLNSRPLTSISDDYNDLQVLTPNHFVTGNHFLF